MRARSTIRASSLRLLLIAINSARTSAEHFRGAARLGISQTFYYTNGLMQLSTRRGRDNDAGDLASCVSGVGLNTRRQQRPNLARLGICTRAEEFAHPAGPRRVGCARVPQKKILAAIMICRGSPSCEMMVPNARLGTEFTGLPGFIWFSMFCPSKRNCR